MINPETQARINKALSLTLSESYDSKGEYVGAIAERNILSGYAHKFGIIEELSAQLQQLEVKARHEQLLHKRVQELKYASRGARIAQATEDTRRIARAIADNTGIQDIHTDFNALNLSILGGFVLLSGDTGYYYTFSHNVSSVDKSGNPKVTKRKFFYYVASYVNEERAADGNTVKSVVYDEPVQIAQSKYELAQTASSGLILETISKAYHLTQKDKALKSKLYRDFSQIKLRSGLAELSDKDAAYKLFELHRDALKTLAPTAKTTKDNRVRVTAALPAAIA